MKKDGGRTPSVRPTTPAENLMILRSRLWDQLSPAERDELHDASAILAHRSETATPNLCSKHGGYGFTSDCRLCNATPQERATAAQSSSPGGDVPACVARYELENIGWRDDNFAMIENEHGDYVKWDDVKHLFAPSAIVPTTDPRIIKARQCIHDWRMEDSSGHFDMLRDVEEILNGA